MGKYNWMFIEKEAVTKDGTECNKIGVSYAAFQNESNKCKKLLGSCLKNQINNLLDEDLELEKKGKKMKYNILTKGDFLDAHKKGGPKGTMLLQEIEGTMSTFLTIEIKADSIEFHQIVGRGVLDFFIIKDFEAHSINGQYKLQAANIGSLAAEFNLSFNCTNNVNSINAKKLFLDSGEIRIITDTIFVQSEIQKNNTCTAQLSDVEGKVVDQIDADFLSSDTIKVNRQTNNNFNDTKNMTQEEQPHKTTNDKERATCHDMCPDFFDILCPLRHLCFDVIKERAMMLVIVIILCLIFYYLILPCLCKICKSKKKKRKKKYEAPQSEASYSMPHQTRKKQIDESKLIERIIKSMSQMNQFQKVNKSNKKSNHSKALSVISDFSEPKTPISLLQKSQIQKPSTTIIQQVQQELYINIHKKDSNMQKYFSQQESFSIPVNIDNNKQIKIVKKLKKTLGSVFKSQQQFDIFQKYIFKNANLYITKIPQYHVLT